MSHSYRLIFILFVYMQIDSRTDVAASQHLTLRVPTMMIGASLKTNVSFVQRKIYLPVSVKPAKIALVNVPTAVEAAWVHR